MIRVLSWLCHDLLGVLPLLGLGFLLCKAESGSRTHPEDGPSPDSCVGSTLQLLGAFALLPVIHEVVTGGCLCGVLLGAGPGCGHWRGAGSALRGSLRRGLTKTLIL